VKRNYLFIILIFVILVFLAANTDESCEYENKSDQDLAEKTEEIMQEINKELGMPAIINFQEKKLAKMIFELRDQENLVTYAYIVNQMTGKLVFIGKCIGFGLPYSVQYTNPEKVITYGGSYHYAGDSPQTIPQADPNGLFMPDGLSATWLMMIDNEGVARPVYVEPQIIVSPFKLH
jgi:hypothetical protein